MCPHKTEIVVKTYLIFICGRALLPPSPPPLPLCLSVSLCDIAPDEPVRDRFDHSGVSCGPLYPPTKHQSHVQCEIVLSRKYILANSQKSWCLPVNQHPNWTNEGLITDLNYLPLHYRGVNFIYLAKLSGRGAVGMDMAVTVIRLYQQQTIGRHFCLQFYR